MVSFAVLAACSKSGSNAPDSKTTLSSTAVTVAPATAAGPGPSGPAAHPFEVQSGIVEMSNSMMNGMTETLYFDDFGAKRATVTKSDTKMLGQSIHTEHVAIDADGYHVEYDPVKKTGSRRKVGEGGMPAPSPSPGGVDVSKLTDEMKKNMKLELLPAKTIDGKVASGYAVDAMGIKIKAWTWKGLPLYTETGLGKAPLIVAAKKVQTDVPVPADKFVVPADVKIKDL